VEDLPLADVQLTHQQLEHLGVHVVLDLQPNRRATDFATEQLLFQGKQQILGVVLLDLHVLIASHPERVVPHHLHAAEQLIKVMSDHVLQRDIAAFGQRDEAGKHGRHLDPGELANARLRIAYQHREVDGQARDVGEGM